MKEGIIWLEVRVSLAKFYSSFARDNFEKHIFTLGYDYEFFEKGVVLMSLRNYKYIHCSLLFIYVTN